MIGWGAETYGECCRGGRETEGHLWTMLLWISESSQRINHTRSAKESSSCPIKLLFFLHRATLPSMKSKNSPKGMNANAAQRFACAEGGPRQYLIEEKIDITPQNPG